MTRFALLAVLAALPFAVAAAPVPAPAPKPLGTNGIVSRAELDALKFDSRPVPAAELKRDRTERVKRVVEVQKKVQAVEAEDGPPKARPANRYDVAVHMPVTRFLVGEPVPAYFVVRNNRAEDLDLDGRLEFVGGAVTESGDCELRLTDARTGKPGPRERVQTYERSRAGFLVIPADGFYCVRGDLGPLPAGEYELDWRCGELRSAPVRFRVFDRDAPARPVARAPRLGYQFFHLGDDHNREREALEGDDGEPVRRHVALDPIEAHEMAAALASGEGTDSTAFVPDVRHIPARDGQVIVSVDWHPYRSGDRVAVTLRAAPPFKTVRFEERPHLYLQLEVPDPHTTSRSVYEAISKKLDAEANFVTPLTIEAHFPEGWREQLGSGETARLAVLVTAREVRQPGDGLHKAVDVRERGRFEHPECPTWRGAVRGDFAELRLPPPAP